MPCHWNWNVDPSKPGGDPGNSIKFAINVVQDKSVGGNISIYIVNLSASDEFKATRANTLTVKFYQHDTLDVDPAAKPKQAKQPKKISSLQKKHLTELALNNTLPFGVLSDIPMLPTIKVADVFTPGSGTACPIKITPRCTVGDTRYECVRCGGESIGGSGGYGHGNGLDSVPRELRNGPPVTK